MDDECDKRGVLAATIQSRDSPGGCDMRYNSLMAFVHSVVRSLVRPRRRRKQC